MSRDRLFGDWYGVKSGLQDAGVSVNIQLVQYYQAVTSGGAITDDAYGGTVEYYVVADSEKMGLWDGFTFNMHTTTQFGNSIEGAAGPLALANTTMLHPLPNYRGTAITGALGLQMINPKLAVAAGKFNSVDIWTMVYPDMAGGFDGFMNTNLLAAALPWFRWVNLSEMGAMVFGFTHGST